MKEPWVTVLWIAAPFGLLALGLVAASRLREDYWASFDLVIYSALAAGAGVLAVVGYLTWYVLRTGPTSASVIPAAVVVLVVGGAAAWWFRGQAGDGACARDHAFYRDLAALSPAERPAALSGAGSVVTDPGPCALEGLTTWFGPDPAPAGDAPMDESERLRSLEVLLDAGLPASDPVLAALARFHDIAGVRLVLGRRVSGAGAGAGGDFPVALFEEIALRTYCVEDSEDPVGPTGSAETPGDRAKREILNVMLELGRPAVERFEPRVRERLRCLGLTVE